MPVLSRKLDILSPKIQEDGALLPIHQATASAGSSAYIVLPCSPPAPTTSLNSGNTINFDIERDTVKLVENICFRFRVQCTTADVELLPPNYWLNRLVIEAERGSADELQHCYPIDWIVWDYLVEDRVGRECSQYFGNYRATPYKSQSAEKYGINERMKFKVGETRDVYLKIPALFFHLNAIDMSHIRADLRLRLEMSNDIVVSGSSNNVSLEGLDLVIDNFAEEDFDRNHRVSKQMSNPHKYLYLDCERYQVSDKTLTAGATTRIELDQFTGKMAYAIIVIKPSTNPSASDQSKIDFVELGPEGTIDITNPSSQSLLGQGTAIKEGHLYQLWTEQTKNPHLKGVYLIPFSSNCKKAITGSMSGGFMEFVGLRDYLELTFDSAPTSEVHTITQNAVSSAGTYRYAFENGAISDQEINYNDGPTVINSALDAMPQLKERGITVTAGGDLTSATQTITFNAGSGKVSDELGKITILGNGTAKVNNSAVTTVGRRGFTTGSNYQINVYMYKYKCLTVAKNGRLTCHDM